jgi:hypothetical protein
MLDCNVVANLRIIFESSKKNSTFLYKNYKILCVLVFFLVFLGAFFVVFLYVFSVCDCSLCGICVDIVCGGEVVWEERYFREPTLRSGLYRSGSGVRERASLERPHSIPHPLSKSFSLLRSWYPGNTSPPIQPP